MNLVDIAAVLIVGLGVYLGYRSGLIIQAAALGGFLVGVGLIVLLAPQATEYVADMEPFMRTVVVLGAVAGIILLAQAVGSGLGAAIKRRIGRGFVGSVDQGLGAGFGLLRGVFIVWLMGGLLGLIGSSVLAAQARQSFVLRTLETRLPSPIVLAAELGRLFQEAGLPEVLVGAPPPIDVPKDAPSPAEAESLAAAARASTVRIEATACGQFYSGTGFAITPDHFVTNAHVVAGSDRVWISFDGSLDRYAATVVDFDSELDAALVYVAGADVPPLRL
ncbi:MAG: CvpA family protein, partial [Candidatus Limnocylindrales bacterium]